MHDAILLRVQQGINHDQTKYATYGYAIELGEKHKPIYFSFLLKKNHVD